MQSTIKLATWGGSKAVRIPKSIVEKLGLGESSEVTVKLSDENEIIITPIYKHKTLDERFKDWNTGYEITNEDQDWLGVNAVGDELW